MITHRPCGACRALVDAEGCEHWRPHRAMLAHIRTAKQEEARRVKNERERARRELMRQLRIKEEGRE